MARIVTDRGLQRFLEPPSGRIKYVYEYDLDCGCLIRADQYMVTHMRGSRNLQEIILQIASTHACGVSVHESPETRRVRPDWGGDGPTYMGVPISTPERVFYAEMGVPIPTPERVLREFYAEMRAPAREPTWLKAKPLPKADLKPEPKDRFDLIEID